MNTISSPTADRLRAPARPRTTSARTTSALAASVALALGASLLTGCSEGRSAEAFCNTMATHRDRYLSAMNLGDSPDITDLLNAASAIGDLKVMWTELADVAPEEIRSDAEAVRDAWAAQEEAALGGNYLGALGTGLLASGSMSRVDAFVRDNCSF